MYSLPALSGSDDDDGGGGSEMCGAGVCVCAIHQRLHHTVNEMYFCDSSPQPHVTGLLGMNKYVRKHFGESLLTENRTQTAY